MQATFLPQPIQYLRAAIRKNLHITVNFELFTLYANGILEQLFDNANKTA
jgi:hypothetical protein